MDKTPMQASTQHFHRMPEPARESMPPEPDELKSGAGAAANTLDRLINGRYRLQAHRGSGRLGAIYEALDEQTSMTGAERHVAVQLLKEIRATSRSATWAPDGAATSTRSSQLWSSRKPRA
jgi:hypothetical protein